MGLFGSTSPFDQYVERATSEKNTSDDWGQIMDICDRVKESPSGPKDCMKSISKRLGSDNPRVVLQTITLLDACINNCGKKFLLEVAGRDFEQELHKLITSSRTHQKVSNRLRESLKKWAEEFKGDPELGLIPSLYAKLQKEGYDFDIPSDAPKKTVKYSNDPNVVNNQQEEEDIAKAIQLSLQHGGSGTAKSSFYGHQGVASGLYSSANAVLTSDTSSGIVEKEPLKVRALYDFEAAEDNELTFKAGEIIIVTDNGDANWWKGTNHRGEGLFPANFVTTSLEDDAEHTHKSENSSNKRVSFSESVEVTEVEDTPSEIAEEVTGEINEDKIDQLIHLLHEADPTGERLDDPSLPLLEEQVNAMAPTIDAELERIDRKHAQLARISTDLVDALNLYHQLMREMPPAMPYYVPFQKALPNIPGMQIPPGAMVPPPHYMPPSGSGVLPQSSMYLPGQMAHYTTMGVIGPYMPPHMGSPTHPGSGTTASPRIQHVPPTSQSGGPPHLYNHYPPVSSDFSGMHSELPPPSSIPTSVLQDSATICHTTSGHLLPQGQGPTPSMAMQGPPVSMVTQSSHPPTSMPLQMPPSTIHQGGPPMSLPQGPPMSMPAQGPPVNIISQGPSPVTATALIQSMPPAHHGPPTSMPFYPTSPPHHLQGMQQPLL